MSLTKKIALAAGAAAVLAAGAWALLRAADGGPAGGALPVAEVARRNLDVVAEAAGLVEPVHVVEVKSHASGQVLAVHAETGDAVERGDLLVEIDPRDVQSALDQAAADLESARVRLTTAEAELARARRLHEQGILPEQDVEVKVEAAASARAALVRVETTLRLAREKREDVVIRASAGGTILERGVEPGQIIASATSTVAGGTTLFLMADLSRMQVRARVDEVDIGRIHPGQEARVTVEAYPGRTFTGEVAKIEPQAVVEQNVTMFPVLVRLENPEGLLRPGMNAEVTLELARRRGAVAVPNAAVVGVRDARRVAALLGLAENAAPSAPAAPERAAASREGAAGGGGTARGGGGTARGGAGPEGAVSGAPRGGGWRGSGAEQVSAAAADTRPAVVFVEGPGGVEARRVLLGVSDWEHTEVVAGLEPGERVVLVTVAQLQRQQQELSDRIRQRFSGPLGSGGNSGRGGGAARGN